MFQAIQSKQILVVDEFIQRNMLGLDCEDHSGNSLLNIAVQYGCFEIAMALIKNGANVNSTNNLGNTPLHYAVAYNLTNLTDLLVESGANENIKNKKRTTAW